MKTLDGRWFHWQAGSEGRPVDAIDDHVLLWSGDQLLVLDQDKPVVRERVVKF